MARVGPVITITPDLRSEHFSTAGYLTVGPAVRLQPARPLLRV